jgi:membrane dipeptidase
MKNIVIDSHCDTALKILQGSNINDSANQVNLKNCLAYDKYIQFFAMYIEPEEITNGPYDLFKRLIKSFKNEVEKNNRYMKIIKNKNELKEYIDMQNKVLGVILTVEDASCLEGNIANLYNLYNEGVRVIGLTWNGRNEIATGVKFSNTKEDGLTKFGEEVVRKMNELGIIIDVSHLSEKSFYDVMKVTSKPVIASHSCSKALCNNLRNLTDEQIRLIANNGGIIGINFYRDFLCEDRNKADVECVVKHIKHISEIGGSKCVCLGSDYDGMSRNNTAKGLEDNSKLINLVNALKTSGFSDEEIDGIMWRNELEFLLRELK